MSTTEPPASGPQPAHNLPTVPPVPSAAGAPPPLPAVADEDRGDAGGSEVRRPRVDLETLRRIHAQVRELVRRESPGGAPGFRVARVLERNISFHDIHSDGHGYAVLGSHAGCDIVLARERGIWARHLAAICVPVDDGRVGLRLVDLATDEPFLLEDDTAQSAVLARGSFALRLGRHVICGFPVGERADADAPSELTVYPPVSQLGATTSTGAVRLTLERGNVGASVDLPSAALDGGVLIGRAVNCCDEGLRRVCGDAISRAHVLILRDGGDLFAFDLCSTNGTREAGKRVRRHRLRGAAPRLELGKSVTLTIASGVGRGPHAAPATPGDAA